MFFLMKLKKKELKFKHQKSDIVIIEFQFQSIHLFYYFQNESIFNVLFINGYQ